MSPFFLFCLFFTSRIQHTRCSLVTGVQTCALPIYAATSLPLHCAEFHASGRIAAQIAEGQGNLVADKKIDCKARIGRSYLLHPRMHVRAAIEMGLHTAARRTGLQHLVDRSEEHTSELQSLMRISYAVFCLKNKNT